MTQEKFGRGSNKMQIDLQPPLAITNITHGDSQLNLNEKEMSTE